MKNVKEQFHQSMDKEFHRNDKTVLNKCVNILLIHLLRIKKITARHLILTRQNKYKKIESALSKKHFVLYNIDPQSIYYQNYLRNVKNLKQRMHANGYSEKTIKQYIQARRHNYLSKYLNLELHISNLTKKQIEKLRAENINSNFVENKKYELIFSVEEYKVHKICFNKINLLKEFADVLKNIKFKNLEGI